MKGNGGASSVTWRRTRLRVGMSTAVPLGAAVLGVEVGYSVVLLSVLACLFEVANTAVQQRSRAAIRPAKYFSLQLGLLYCVQIWLLILASGGQAPTAAADAAYLMDAQARVASQEHEASRPQVDSDDQHPREQARQALRKAPAPVSTPAPIKADAGVGDPMAPFSAPVPGGFELEASKEALRWSPKTISIVLPCAEERDLAYKTVQSAFENTPSEVLHEIVVVDDGSNPPLADTHLKADVQRKFRVKIERHESTVGLIGAKKTGGDAATGDIIVFFDCHVAPQKDWEKDFLQLIGENYRRMVVPQITSLDIDTWTQIGAGGGMSKCYVTWDGDFKWGGTDDMYMGMLSGGLAGMSRRWWWESGGFDDQMLGWGGENIDQGVRMWVCGGEIVAAPNAQVAHMWRTGDKKTSARYKHVGDTMRNRARAINAWMGEFSVKLDEFPAFKSRRDSGGDQWFGDMSPFEKVKDKLQGCRPFAWYLRRFKGIYEDAGIVPPDIFMLREESSGKCLFFQGHAGTSGQGRETVSLADCDENNDRMFWHLGNQNMKTKKCCSGLRAWNTEQCFQGVRGGKAETGICEISGRNSLQTWSFDDGKLRQKQRCIGTHDGHSLVEEPCMKWRNSEGGQWTKQAVKEPVETRLYKEARSNHPEIFTKLDIELKELDGAGSGPQACRDGQCITIEFADGSGRCISDDGGLTSDKSMCAVVVMQGGHIKKAEGGDCLDSFSDASPETWCWYGCHDGSNQKFEKEGPVRICAVDDKDRACFRTEKWTLAR